MNTLYLPEAPTHKLLLPAFIVVVVVVEAANEPLLLVQHVVPEARHLNHYMLAASIGY